MNTSYIKSQVRNPCVFRFAIRFGDDRSDEEGSTCIRQSVSGDAQRTRARSIQLAILAICTGLNLGGTTTHW